VLIDPWILALPDGAARLATSLWRLGSWIALIVVADRDDPQFATRGHDLVEQAHRIARRIAGDHARLALDADRFRLMMPVVISDAWRHYVQSGYTPRRTGTGSSRPRLAGPITPPPDGTRRGNDD
jgi:hypothetical protein